MRTRIALLFSLAACLMLGSTQADPNEDAQVLASKETTPDARGQSERIKLLRTNHKHPLVRKVERVESDPATGTPKIVSSVERGRNGDVASKRPGDSGWNGTSWPASPGTADVTQWNFEAATGLLTSKVYGLGAADTDTLSYTYTTDGKLYTRTGGRGLVTTYGYDPATGELTGIDYPAGNPATDVTFAYDRLGRQVTITDAVGTRTLAYRASDLQTDTNELLDAPTFFELYRIWLKHDSKAAQGEIPSPR